MAVAQAAVPFGFRASHWHFYLPLVELRSLLHESLAVESFLERIVIMSNANTNEIDWMVPSGTFMGIPNGRTVRPGQAAIIGIPFDCGTHPTRIGSRQGPAAIRQQSGLVRPHYPPLSDTNVLIDLNCVDLGDVAVTSSEVDKSFSAIEHALDSVLFSGGYPVTMGGDGSISLPQLRAVHRHYPDLVLLHIDAHTDAYDVPGYNTSSTFMRAAEERLIDVERSYHVGARGSLALPGIYEHTRNLGYRLILGDDIRRRGVGDVMAEVRGTIGKRPVYLCFDMDYIDPSCAPGVATPTWGGPSADAAFDLLHVLAGLKIVSFDVNTVSPPHDLGGMTACLAAHVMLIGLHLIALGRNAG
jgi:agmatinase